MTRNVCHGKIWKRRGGTDGCRLNTRSGGKSRYLVGAKPCPTCHAEPDMLSWFYFESPKWTWENLCGSAGWMAVCDSCKRQVDYFEEVMS